jgi:hypothetical protein
MVSMYSQLQGWKAAGFEVLTAAKNVESAACWLLARLIFVPEDGVDTLLRNVCSHTDYTALYPRRWQQGK